MLKWIGIGCIVLSCILLGFLKAQDLGSRVASLKTLHWCCLMMSGEIRCQQPTLPELFCRIGKQISKKYGIIFIEIAEELKRKGGQNFSEIWDRIWKVHQKELCLKEEDYCLIQSLGTSLGYLDRKMQLSTLEYFLERLSQRMEDAETEKRSGQKVYQMLGVTGGLLFMVLFV